MPLISALLTIIAAQTAPLEIAYVARYYTPATSNVRSHFQLYLTDLNGKRRVRLAGPLLDRVYYLRWKNHNTLTWGTDSESWHSVDVATGVRGTLKTPKDLGEGQPGDLFSHERAISFPGEAPILWSEDLGKRWRFERGGKAIVFGYEDHDLQQPNRLISNGASQTYLIAGIYTANGMGEEEFMYVLDWKSGKLKFIRGGVKAICLYPERDLMVCLQGDRNMSPLGDLSVWTGELYAMRLSKNKLWPIVKGMVNVTSFALRPPK